MVNVNNFSHCHGVITNLSYYWYLLYFVGFARLIFR